MIDFAHALHEVAILFEMLWQRHHVRQRGTEVRHQIPNLRRIGPGARHQAGARRRTDGLLAVGATKRHTALGDAIDVGRFDGVHAIAAQFGPQVIDGNEQDVRLGGIGGAECKSSQREKAATGNLLGVHGSFCLHPKNRLADEVVAHHLFHIGTGGEALPHFQIVFPVVGKAAKQQ